MMSGTRKVVTRERPFVFEATGVGFSRNQRDEVRRGAFGNPLALVELPRAWHADEAWKHPSKLPIIARLEGLAVQREGATK